MKKENKESIPGFQFIIETSILPEDHKVSLLIAPGQFVFHSPVVFSSQNIVIPTNRLHNYTSTCQDIICTWLSLLPVFPLYIYRHQFSSKTYPNEP